jgi:hypothetical protein
VATKILSVTGRKDVVFITIIIHSFILLFGWRANEKKAIGDSPPGRQRLYHVTLTDAQIG